MRIIIIEQKKDIVLKNADIDKLLPQHRCDKDENFIILSCKYHYIITKHSHLNFEIFLQTIN